MLHEKLHRKMELFFTHVPEKGMERVRTRKWIDPHELKRLMALMRLGAKQGITLTFTLEGPDEEEAADTLLTFIRENL